MYRVVLCLLIINVNKSNIFQVKLLVLSFSMYLFKLHDQMYIYLSHSSFICGGTFCRGL